MEEQPQGIMLGMDQVAAGSIAVNRSAPQLSEATDVCHRILSPQKRDSMLDL